MKKKTVKQEEIDEEDSDEDQKDDDEEEELPEPKSTRRRGDSISIHGPLAFWIGFLIFALILEFGSFYLGIASLNTAAKLIIELPGSVILALITAMWIGERVSRGSESLGEATKKGIINSIYASLIYMVTIFIVYVILDFANASLLKISVNSFFTYQIAIPVAIVIFVSTIFGLLATARRLS